MVNKRPASALTEGALKAHGADGAMSLEEKMQKIKDEQDPFICFNVRLVYIMIHNITCYDLSRLVVSSSTSGP